MKYSFTIIELLLCLFLLITLSFIYTSFSKNIKNTNIKTYEKLQIQIDLLSTLIFIEKNIKEIDNIIFRNKTLYFKHYIIQKEVFSFIKSKNSNSYFIKVCLKNTCKEGFIYE